MFSVADEPAVGTVRITPTNGPSGIVTGVPDPAGVSVTGAAVWVTWTFTVPANEMFGTLRPSVPPTCPARLAGDSIRSAWPFVTVTRPSPSERATLSAETF